MNDERLYLATELYGEEFDKLCSPIKEYLNLDNGIYYNISEDGGMHNINLNNQWLKDYVSQQHYLTDPHIVHPKNMQPGFCLLLIQDKYNFQKYNDVLLYDCDNKNNFNYGFTYVLKEKHDFSAFCFTTNRTNYIFNKVLIGSKIVESYIKALNKQIRALLHGHLEYRVDMSVLKGTEFFTQKGIVFH